MRVFTASATLSLHFTTSFYISACTHAIHAASCHMLSLLLLPLGTQVMEFYALGGRGVVTSRVYALPPAVAPGVPGNDVDLLGAWGLTLIAAGPGVQMRAEAVVYKLQGAIVS